VVDERILRIGMGQRVSVAINHVHNARKATQEEQLHSLGNGRI